MYNLLLVFLLLSSTVSNENYQLTIEIQNIEVVEGTIRIGIYNTSETFLKKGAFYRGDLIVVANSTESVTFKNLPAGEYAFMLYHDKNSDGKFNQNFLGIPKEPYGFSNNVKIKFSKPKFKECKFFLTKDSVMRIKLRNYK